MEKSNGRHFTDEDMNERIACSDKYCNQQNCVWALPIFLFLTGAKMLAIA